MAFGMARYLDENEATMQAFPHRKNSTEALGCPRASVLCLQPPTEILNPLQPLFNIGHAGCVADADVIIRPEGNAGDCGDFFLLQQLRAELSRFKAQFRNVREQIKGALGIYTTHARNAV